MPLSFHGDLGQAGWGWVGLHICALCPGPSWDPRDYRGEKTVLLRQI